MTKGEVHIHTSNCTVVAVDDELGVVYMTCVTGAAGHKITESSKFVKVVNMHSALGGDGKVQPVVEVKGRCIHWAMLDEEDMHLLIKKGKFFLLKYSYCCFIVDIIIVVLLLMLLLLGLYYCC
jgi:hypothetical protein